MGAREQCSNASDNGCDMRQMRHASSLLIAVLILTNFPGFEKGLIRHRADTGRYADFVPPSDWDRGYDDDRAGVLDYLLE